MNSDWQPTSFDMIRIEAMVYQQLSKEEMVDWFENDEDTNLDKDYFKKLIQWIEDNIEKRSP